MYGIVVCRSCGKKRITDLRSETSTCPYCSKIGKVGDMDVLFSDKSQSVVRSVLNGAEASRYPEPRRKGDVDPDPLSTLVYEYEHTSGTVGKLTVLAQGLTRIKGEFTETDVDGLFPGEGKKLLEQMAACDVVIELRHGTYKAV